MAHGVFQVARSSSPLLSSVRLYEVLVALGRAGAPQLAMCDLRPVRQWDDAESDRDTSAKGNRGWHESDSCDRR